MTARQKLHQRAERRQQYYRFEDEDLGEVYVKAPTVEIIKKVGMLVGGIADNFHEIVADFIIANSFELIDGCYQLAYELADRDIFLEEMNPLFGFVLNECLAAEFSKIKNENIKK